MEEKNYYDILGVEKTSSQEDIKKAYRVLSKQFHPDINKESEEKFKEISEAYAVLSDVEKRREYDTYGVVFNISTKEKAVKVICDLFLDLINGSKYPEQTDFVRSIKDFFHSHKKEIIDAEAKLLKVIKKYEVVKERLVIKNKSFNILLERIENNIKDLDKKLSLLKREKEDVEVFREAVDGISYVFDKTGNIKEKKKVTPEQLLEFFKKIENGEDY